MCGFDFYIDCDEKPAEVKKSIKDILRRVGLPWENIEVSRPVYELPKSKIWSLRRIENCIEKEAPEVQ